MRRLVKWHLQSGSRGREKCLLLSHSNMIFSLIIWEFHTKHPDPPFVIPSTLQQKKKKYTKFNLCCPHPLWSVLTLPVFSPLKKTEPPPPTLPEATNCEELHFSIPITVLRALFNGFWSRLFPLVGVAGVVTETFNGSHFSIVSLQSQIPL